MNDIFRYAVNISTPLALAGFICAVLFLVLRTILRRNDQPVEVVSKILTGLFILCLVAMILGFFGFAITQRAPSPGPSSVHEALPCEGEWDLSIDFSRLAHDTTTKYVGVGRASMTWVPSSQAYDILIWVTVAEPGKGDAPLLTSVTRGTLEADSIGKPTATSMQLDYLAQTGRAPYDKPPFGHLIYTDLQFESSVDGKRVKKIVGRYHSNQTDAAITFSRIAR